MSAKAKLLQNLNAAGLTAEDLAAVLPDGVTALRALGDLGRASPEAVAEQLRAWNKMEQAKAEAKLHAWTLPFTDDQRSIVMEAVEKARTRRTSPTTRARTSRAPRSRPSPRSGSTAAATGPPPPGSAGTCVLYRGRRHHRPPRRRER